jgi:hypothetical protein
LAQKNINLDYKLIYNLNEASQSIFIESSQAMDLITLRSPLFLEMLEISGSLATQSMNKTIENEDNIQVFTFKMTEQNIYKFEIRLRTSEGKMGDLEIGVIPISNPLAY